MSVGRIPAARRAGFAVGVSLLAHSTAGRWTALHHTQLRPRRQIRERENLYVRQGSVAVLNTGDLAAAYIGDSRAKGEFVRQTKTTLPPAVFLTLANGFLDAHTYLGFAGVFANVQTANVIFFAVNLVEQHWAPALARLWPIFAFTAGVAIAAHIKSGRIQQWVSHPLRWTMAIQAAFFVGVGFIPRTVPASFITVPIAFLAGVQIGLFRSIGDLNYLPVATTGNLMRLVETGYSGFIDGERGSRRAFRVYATLIGAFTVGAGFGTATTRAWGHHAIWIPAIILMVALVLVVFDERAGKTG